MRESGQHASTANAAVGKMQSHVSDRSKVVFDDSLRHPVRVVAVKIEPLSGRSASVPAEQARPQKSETGASINCEPGSLAADISARIEAVMPRRQDIEKIRGQLLGLEAQATPELIVESFYRCVLTDWLQRKYAIGVDRLPDAVNSSHRAARLVCNARSVHPHSSISPAAWESAWQRLRPTADIYVPNTGGGRSLKRADLYVVTAGQVVSIEFKYVERHGLRDPKGIAEQMQRFVKYHAATILVIYSGSHNRSDVPGVAQVRRGLPQCVPIVVISGPAIPPAPKR